MPDPSIPLHTLACPTCGAPLDIDPQEPDLHCQYCSTVVENPGYHPHRTPKLVEVKIPASSARVPAQSTMFLNRSAAQITWSGSL